MQTYIILIKSIAALNKKYLKVAHAFVVIKIKKNDL